MATRNSWEGFKPDTTPVPETPIKSASEQLDDIAEQISTLEEKRKELLFEVAKQEAREDEDFLEEVHKDCISKEEFDEVNKEAEFAAEDRADAEEAWGYLQEFGAHTAACLSGALVGDQKLHPLCTCGWNHVATELERG